MKPGDLIRFVRNPPPNSRDTGIWVYEYGLIVNVDKESRTISVLSGKDVINVRDEWCSLAREDKRDFIDDLAERYLKSEVGS